MSDWPRISTILADVGLAPDFSMVDPGVLEGARARGGAVHEAIEAHHYQYGVDLPVECAPYFAAYLRFLKESGHEPILSEFEVKHPQWRYVGHPDRIGWLLGKRALLDWKCTDGLDLEPVRYQLAGYWQAWNDTHPTERLDLAAAVQLRSDGTYRLHEIDAAGAAHVFLAAATVYWARREMGRAA